MSVKVPPYHTVQKSPRLPHVHGEIAPPCRTTAPLHKITENLWYTPALRAAKAVEKSRREGTEVRSGRFEWLSSPARWRKNTVHVVKSDRYMQFVTLRYSVNMLIKEYQAIRFRKNIECITTKANFVSSPVLSAAHKATPKYFLKPSSSDTHYSARTAGRKYL